MKKILAITIAAIASLLIGCASSGPAQRPVAHQIEVKVTGEKASVAADMIREKYKLPDSPYLKPSQLMMLNRAETKAFIKIFSGLSVSDVTRMWQDVLYLAEETDITDVQMFINSPGGDAFTGLALADLIVDAQKYLGLKFTARGSGIIASAAVPVFTVCEYRIAAPGTIFMVHEAALWKWPGRESASDIRSQNELMILLQDRYLGYLVPRSKLSLEEWQRMEKATTWFSAEKAMDEVGIVDEIK